MRRGGGGVGICGWLTIIILRFLYFKNLLEQEVRIEGSDKKRAYFDPHCDTTKESNY